ncbi:MAG: hypothetical protein KME29_24830 [Calothrix sp. FI2-JRJ7]|jgi:hypothetical protein|nr:hypothetical protein [Calothrix sp. FI2-JRJ7]
MLRIHPQFWQQANDTGVKILDTIQVQMGNVNLHSQEEAVKIASSTCIRKERESQAKVVAYVTALYMQHEIHRAAQVGGNLLKRFGKSYFPHIKDRELHFALEVDSELENYLYTQIINQS